MVNQFQGKRGVVFILFDRNIYFNHSVFASILAVCDLMSHHHEMFLLWMNQARYCICFTREQKYVFHVFSGNWSLFFYISLTAEDMASMRFWQQGNPMQSHGVTIQVWTVFYFQITRILFDFLIFVSRCEQRIKHSKSLVNPHVQLQWCLLWIWASPMNLINFLRSWRSDSSDRLWRWKGKSSD